jgi:hypothetical protein
MLHENSCILDPDGFLEAVEEAQVFKTARTWMTAFYWIGVAAAVTLLAVILAGNTDLLWRFEHRSFPLSWGLAGAAVLAFLAAEICHFPVSLPDTVEDRRREFSPEYEAVEW